MRYCSNRPLSEHGQTMNGKILVYTTIFNRYDRLNDIPFFAYEPDIFDYVCFADRKIRSKTYHVQQVMSKRNPVMKNRLYKIMIDSITKKKYLGSIYLDGNVRIKGNLSQVFNFEYDLAVHDHARDCIYEEARTVILKKKDHPRNVNRWLERLKNEGYPKESGLFWNGILIRKHSAKMRALSEEWWYLLNQYSYRDQLTLPYLVKKHGVSVNCIPRTLDRHGVFENEFFYYDGHHISDSLWNRVFALFSSKK
jgi:hypothetical protein